MKASGWLPVLLALGACCTTKTPASAPNTVNMSAVIDRVKLELNKFENSSPKAVALSAKPACSTNGKTAVMIVPTKGELVLKVTSTNTVNGSIGAKIPVGKVITIDPKFSRSDETIATHALTLDLDILHPPSAAELRNTIDSINKDITTYAKAQVALARSNPGLSELYKIKAEEKKNDLNRAYRALIDKVSNEGPLDLSRADPAAPKDYQIKLHDIPQAPPELSGYALASTLWSVREQLLYVDHSLTPCVKPSQLEVDIDFEVQATQGVDASIDIVIVSVEAGRSKSTDTLQHLKVLFDMSESSAAMIQ